MDVPRTKYTKSGDIHIAYQVVGEGPLDIVLVRGFVSHLEFEWEEPRVARVIQRLASFARLIRFDRRGTGLSDRPPGIATLEQRIDDVRAVMDAVGSEKAALFGVSEGGPMSLLFAATYPERTSALVLYGSYARRAWAPDHPIGITELEMERVLETLERDWGGPAATEIWAPGKLGDDTFGQWRAKYLRLAASPGSVLALMRANMETDVRHILPVIRVPTLLVHRTGDRLVRVDQARYMAERIPGAKLVELPGDDHTFYVEADPLLDEVEEFLTGIRRGPEPDRVLATILLVDIVGSTERAAELGDREWGNLLRQYYAIVRREVSRFRGREIDTAGDGVFASFDGPARAVRCACVISDAVRSLGIAVRAGLHTGECEVIEGKPGGIAVHIGARVAAMAEPGQVLASSTVKDLVAGSGLQFVDKGTHALKGVPGEWRLFSVAAPSPVS